MAGRIGNHNNLLGRVNGVDGIKTGYVNASGFNLVTSVKRDGRKVVAVVMGGKTAAQRDAHMVQLINTYLPRASRSRGYDDQLVADVMSAPKVGCRQRPRTGRTGCPRGDGGFAPRIPRRCPVPMMASMDTAADPDPAVVTASVAPAAAAPMPPMAPAAMPEEVAEAPTPATAPSLEPASLATATPAGEPCQRALALFGRRGLRRTSVRRLRATRWPTWSPASDAHSRRSAKNVEVSLRRACQRDDPTHRHRQPPPARAAGSSRSVPSVPRPPPWIFSTRPSRPPRSLPPPALWPNR